MKEQTVALLGTFSTFTISEAHKANICFRYKFDAFNLSEVFKEVLKLFFGAFRGNVSHNEIHLLHAAFELVGALCKLKTSLLFGLGFTNVQSRLLVGWVGSVLFGS
jgi:hypothetical protein